MTDEQKHAMEHAQKVLRSVKLYDLAASLAPTQGADARIATLEAENAALRHDIKRHIANHAADLNGTSQGADALPVAIIPPEWLALMEECATFHGKMVKGNWLSSEAKHLLATRDTAPRDGQDAALKLAERAVFLNALYYNKNCNPAGFQFAVESLADDAKKFIAAIAPMDKT